MLTNSHGSGVSHSTETDTQTAARRVPVLQPTERQATIVGQEFYIAPARMFAYPTRLISAWDPQIMQIHLPEHTKPATQVDLAIAPGATQSYETQTANPYKRLYKKLSPPLELPDTYLYDNRHDTDGNIAHVLTNSVTRLLSAQAAFPDLPPITVVLRSNATPMAQRVYELLGFPVLCTDREVRGNLISITENCEGAYEWNYPALFGARSFEGYVPDTPERVFISRKGQRSLLNEADVEQLLTTYGFVKFYYEDIPISQQWSIARNAKAVVAIHGAALSSLAFNRHSVKLLEFFHPGYVVDMYRNLVNAIGGSWTGVIGQLHPEVVRDLDFKQKARQYALSRTVVDTTSLRMALENLGIEKQG